MGSVDFFMTIKLVCFEPTTVAYLLLATAEIKLLIVGKWRVI